MPAPLPPSRRTEVVALLEAGVGPSEVARRTGVSRQTVHRWRTAARVQGRRVPRPRAMGGYRGSKVKRADLHAVAAAALAEPKRTLAELQGEVSQPVSLSTVSRTLHKVGLRKRRARFVDRRTETHAFIAAERAAFRRAQRDEPSFAPQRLLFFDETLFSLNEQARQAWGPTHGPPPILHRPKGRTLTTGLWLTLGLTPDNELILHYRLQPPRRPFHAVSSVFEASELVNPGRGIPVALDVTRAPCTELRALLRSHGVLTTGSRAALVARVQALQRHGLVGLPRAGRRDVGGPLQAFRSTVRDVVQYWAEDFVPWWEAHHPHVARADYTVVWDNASTHSAVAVNDPSRRSLFHRLFRADWRFAGCVFLPPRSPAFNPVELAFAYVKHWVRKGAPAEGYTQAGLEAAIHGAVARIPPATVQHWISGCGYRGRREEEEKAPLPLSPRWADANGTLFAAPRAGLTDVRARPRRHSPPPPPPVAQRRWPGYGPEPSGAWTETEPRSYTQALVDHVEVFEPERIVDERRRGDEAEYRIRWKGYPPAADTWEPVVHLQVGRDRLLRDWVKRRPAR